MFREGIFSSASDWNASEITLIDSILSSYLSESDIRTSQFDEITPTSSNTHRTVTNNCNVDNYFLPLEELMDSLRSAEKNGLSTYMQADKSIDTVSSDKKPIER